MWEEVRASGHAQATLELVCARIRAT
jgi:hypothetical protein